MVALEAAGDAPGDAINPLQALQTCTFEVLSHAEQTTYKNNKITP